ncbi:MAG: protein kinase [Candidatus Eisenbacteria bacterium]|nr:protein kinase [Candidatus Eisenbacteria bacterium]
MVGKTISHYKILEKLGEGGMGVVYKAEDTKLGRHAALKFLSPDLTRDPEARKRFIQEAKAASSLDHTSICTVHEIGETEDGQIFIVTAFYEGETLKTKIERGSLKVEEALDIAIHVAQGLGRAHEAGIVHRDIKPANIMITKRGDVKIVDFGLAKLTGQAKLTVMGSTVGTVAYMSPEQVQGEDIDHRTDIWALGVVLYEMLTGRSPFKGEHEAALLYSIVHEEPQSLSLVRSGTPAPVSSVIARALQKDRALRYQTAQELIDELRKLTVSGRPPRVELPRQEKSIVVLPFENLSPDPDQEYFSDGLTEEVISDLSKVHALRVISRSSAMTFKGTKKTIPEIAKQLEVQYVLEGSVRKAGNSLRITAQLIDAASDAHIWAEKYSGTLDDVFDVQEKVSRAIVDALKLKLTPEESRKIAERPIDNVAAYQCYLKANAEIWRFTESSLEMARLHLQKGLDILGDNALLYSAMAFVYWQYANIGAGQEDYVAKAEQYTNKALALDPDSPQAHLVIGMIHGAFYGNTREGVRQLRMALAVNPNYVDALKFLAGFCTMSVGKLAAAIPLVQRVKEIDPLDPWNYWLQGRLFFYGGQYKLALEQLRQHYQSDPENPVAQFFCAWTLTYANEIDEAFSIIDRSAKATPNNVCTKFGLLLKYGLLKDRESAFREMTPDFQKTCRRDHQWSYFVAVPLALLDAREESIDWLENAVNGGFINYPELERNQNLDNLRGEERFKKLMERVKYEWEHFEE